MNNEEYNKYIDELRLHGTRELAEEVYRLEEENEILKKALLFIWKNYGVEEINIDELKKALKEIEMLGGDE